MKILIILLSLMLASCAMMQPGERDFYLNDLLIEVSKEIK